MHNVSDRTSRVSLTQYNGELPISHYLTGRYLADDLINAFAVGSVVNDIHARSHAEMCELVNRRPLLRRILAGDT